LGEEDKQEKEKEDVVDTDHLILKGKINSYGCLKN
jgi:hypothetical protein